MQSERDYRAVVRRQIHVGAQLDQSFLVMNGLATVVACYGLLLNSTAVVIGAMLIAMLLGPIMGIALGLVDGDQRLLGTALLTEVVGAGLVLGLAVVIGVLHADIPAGSEMMARTAPNILDEVVALAGGAAVAYALASRRLAAGMVGVAIATALVPPLAACGMFLGRGELDLARGALLLYLANFVAIQFSASVVLWLQGFHKLVPRTGRSLGSVLVGNAISVVVLMALTAVLAFNFYQSASTERFDREVRTAVADVLAQLPDTELVSQRFELANGTLVVDLTVRSLRDLRYDEVLALQTDLATRLQLPTALRLFAVPARVLDPLVPPTLTPTPVPTATPVPTHTPTASPTPTETPTPESTPISQPR